MNCVLVSLIVSLLLLQLVSVSSNTTEEASFFAHLWDIANRDPVSVQDLYENENFLHAASVKVTVPSSVHQHAIQQVHMDPCIWQVLDNAKMTASFLRPSTLLSCNQIQSSSDIPDPATDITTSSTKMTDSPPYPSGQSQQWLLQRYKKDYVALTNIQKFPKPVGFREWKNQYDEDNNNNDDDDDDDDDNDNGNGNDDDDVPAVDYTRFNYDADSDQVLQSATIRQVSESPKVYVIDNFATEEEMNTLREINDQYSYNKKKHDTTGASFEMSVHTSEVSYRISKRMSALLKMKNHMGSTLRTRLYKSGESHPPHVDWFEIKNQDGSTSNLIATAMLNMVTTIRGGDTEFLDAVPSSVKVSPQRGQLVLWWSCTKEGSKDHFSLHQGNKIERGTKFTVTQFFYNSLDSCHTLDEFYNPITKMEL